LALLNHLTLPVIRIVLFLPCNGAAPKRRRDTCPILASARTAAARDMGWNGQDEQART
jgi:hypothetical protein